MVVHAWHTRDVRSPLLRGGVADPGRMQVQVDMRVSVLFHRAVITLIKGDELPRSLPRQRLTATQDEAGTVFLCSGKACIGDAAQQTQAGHCVSAVATRSPRYHG